MKSQTNSSPDQRAARRLLATLAVCLPVAALALLSSSFLRLGTLQPDEVLNVNSAYAAHQPGEAGAPLTITVTGTVTITVTVTVTETGTATPGVTETGTPNTTTTPGVTETGTTTTTPIVTTTGTPAPSGTTTPGVTTTGTTTPGATTTGTPQPGCTPTANAAISITEAGFVPPVSIVEPGTRVTWTNNGTREHRVRDINHVLFDSGDLQPGQSFSYVFCFPGTYAYEDTRSNFTGTVIVTGIGSVTPSVTGTGTPNVTGTTTPGVTETTTPGVTTTTTGTPNTTTTPGVTETGTTTPIVTTTGTPAPSGTTTPGVTTTGTTTPGATTTGTPQPSTTASPSATACTIEFNDVRQDNPFYPYIKCLACRGIISGYTDATNCPPTVGGPPCFRWENNVTRGQLSKIVSEAAGYREDPGAQQFNDVPANNPFFVWINRLANRNIISGYSDAANCPATVGGPPCFRWERNATRGQISKIVSEAAGFVEDPGPQRFTDVPSQNPFYTWINRLANRQVISGYNDPVTCAGVGTPCFRWERDATRGQTSRIVANAFYPNCSP